MDSHRNLRRNLGQLRIKSQIDSQLCESKINKTCYQKRLIHMNFVESDDWLHVTVYLILNDLRPLSRTTVTFKMLSIVMWYLIRAAVKNMRINLGQLRIKRQIDSQLCDSIFAAYIQACIILFRTVFSAISCPVLTRTTALLTVSVYLMCSMRRNHRFSHAFSLFSMAVVKLL